MNDELNTTGLQFIVHRSYFIIFFPLPALRAFDGAEPAAVEAFAFGLGHPRLVATRDVASAMERDSGVRLKDLRVDGGAVGNEFLMQFQADILGVAVEVPEVTETTAAGAAYLAGLAVGFWQDRREIAARWRVARRYEPQMPEAERERLQRRWLRAVERAKSWEREDEEGI